MSEKIINSIIASIVGCISSVGMVWYLAEQPIGPINPQSQEQKAIENDTLRVKESLKIVDSNGNVLVEFKEGNLFVQKDIVAGGLSSEVVTSKKYKIINGNPQDKGAPLFGEMAVQENGGAYLALLSPQGTHSMNIGFDKKETGFIISQNNEDNSIVAQAILPKPNAKDAAQSKLQTGIQNGNLNASGSSSSFQPFSEKSVNPMIPAQTGMTGKIQPSSPMPPVIPPSSSSMASLPLEGNVNSGIPQNSIPSGNSVPMVQAGVPPMNVPAVNNISAPGSEMGRLKPSSSGPVQMAAQPGTYPLNR